MDPGPPLTFAGLAQRILASPPRLGRTRLVCIDGPAGSGKTTLAGRLAQALHPDAVVVHFDDLYAGWTLTGAAARLQAGVLRPVSEGRPGAFHRYDWTVPGFTPEPTPVPARAVLVVEGCGSSPRVLDAWTTLRIWVEAPPALRIARGLARDGIGLEAEWLRWQRTEATEFTRERTRERADLHVDGSREGQEGPGRLTVLRPDTWAQHAARTIQG
ncbi:uridine kinase family protein [Blastococcus sp. PRF04-17]|uniref:uridine kinase family protein n=1 Tax=Blastococcus sp. PRF04-17 TaxID=2933797 RepID=UPI001FF10DAD|nr:uridine kinase [Blastococcus sp. PRF04-17]UOY02689.1 uridine kinase [Blastococcus sp. PRF04-17]